MKFFLFLSPIFLGSSLSVYYYLLKEIDFMKGFILLFSTFFFFFICLIYIVLKKRSRNYVDTVFLSIMLSSVTLPVCYFLYKYFSEQALFLVMMGSSMVYVLMLVVGLRIMKRWYNYVVPYLER